MIIGLMMAKNSSNRLKNKNLREITPQMTLFEYSLRECLRYPWYDEFMVISNCKEIEKICKKYPEVVFLKEPKVVAELDDSWQVIKFVMKVTGLFPEDVLVYVSAATPLRKVKDIKNALALYEIHKNNGCTSVVSVKKCKEPPEWSFKIKDGYLDIKSLKMTSQELEDHYHLNGSIYISKVSDLEKYDGYFKGGKVKPYIMPYKRSVNIDRELDFELIKCFLKNKEYKYNYHKTDEDSSGKIFENEVK